jgi:hypothetical protein
MSVKELTCPKCGASVSPDRNVCDYCKAQYIIVREPKAILLEENTQCNTFQTLQLFHKKAELLLKKVESGEIEDEEAKEFGVESRNADRLLRACRVCHIKNCQFFNAPHGLTEKYLPICFKALRDTPKKR